MNSFRSIRVDFPLRTRVGWIAIFLLWVAMAVLPAVGQNSGSPGADRQENAPGFILADPGRFDALTEPPCSYCVDQNLKKLVLPDDTVLAWIRGAHNGGAFPLRHFIANRRVINDTYGLFFYDPDGGYVAAFEKNYGFRFHGWRGGVMVVASEDGTLWSALTGTAFAGPQEGKKLNRVPSLTTSWEHWLLLHPESTAYNLFDGKRYPVADLPVEMSKEARSSMVDVDPRLEAMTPVLGIEGDQQQLAIPLAQLPKRHVVQREFEGRSIVVFWYERTRSAVAFSAEVDGRPLTFHADPISPETAPFKDRETGTRWTLAGRGIDGPLRGKELSWIPSIQCRWYAWSHEYPGTEIQPPENLKE